MSDLATGLLLAQAKLDAMPPAPRAIWFVDRSSVYRQFVGLLADRDMPRIEDGVISYGGGMPVYSYTQEEIRQGIFYAIRQHGLTLPQARRTWPVCQPGIWVIKTKGPPEQLTLAV